ncbi:MAG: hypothetical protein WKG07_09330, partial [Hymenobacter sp.]
MTAAPPGELLEAIEPQTPDLYHDLPVGRQPAPAGLAVATAHQTLDSLPPSSQQSAISNPPTIR